MTHHAHWIWAAEAAAPDEYADFLLPLDVGPGEYHLQISSDSDYALYLDGALLAFGQYPDTLDRKVCDEIDLTPHLQQGRNNLILTVWHYGLDTQTHEKKPAGVRFAVLCGEQIVLCSGEAILSRLNAHYLPHQEAMITPQLGLTFSYRAEASERPWRPSVLAVGLPEQLTPRPIEKLPLLPLKPGAPVLCGSFLLSGGRTAAQRMQQALLSVRSERTNTLSCSSEEDGVFWILDLEEEEAGLLQLELEVPAPCTVEIGWGEHLLDGRCRTAVRNFACVYKAPAGRSTYLNPFRRFGCRYVQLFVYSSAAALGPTGLRPTPYPLEAVPFSTGSLLRDRIYETCVRTLRLCMHEHYEDCPWREQALYAMDSRSQMLCGYDAFVGSGPFARASLDLLRRSVLPHGLLNLCAPCGPSFPIPSFSLVFFSAMEEYGTHTGDLAFLRDSYPMLTDLMEVFLRKPRHRGIMENFYGPGDFWNFYEWSDGMEGQFCQQEQAFEAPLNAMASLALQALGRMARSLGRTADADRYDREARSFNEALHAVFYDRETKLFHSFLDRRWEQYSVLTNSLCLLCGAADGVDQSRILDILVCNGPGDSGLSVVSNTLSMNLFRYEALLRTDRSAYAPKILEELDRVYLDMLCQGATTFWETALGAEDFDGAGSLCHGWSALPVYYYHKLL